MTGSSGVGQIEVAGNYFHFTNASLPMNYLFPLVSLCLYFVDCINLD